MSVICIVTLPVQSGVHKITGNWSYTRHMSLPAVPRAGDYVIPAPGWASYAVEHTAFTENAVYVRLKYITVTSHEQKDALDNLPGWTRQGGPWERKNT